MLLELSSLNLVLKGLGSYSFIGQKGGERERESLYSSAFWLPNIASDRSPNVTAGWDNTLVNNIHQSKQICLSTLQVEKRIIVITISSLRKRCKFCFSEFQGRKTIS